MCPTTRERDLRRRVQQPETWDCVCLQHSGTDTARARKGSSKNSYEAHISNTHSVASGHIVSAHSRICTPCQSSTGFPFSNSGGPPAQGPGYEHAHKYSKDTGANAHISLIAHCSSTYSSASGRNINAHERSSTPCQSWTGTATAFRNSYSIQVQFSRVFESRAGLV